MRKISAALAFGAAVLATPSFAAVSFTSVAGTTSNNAGVAGATANMTFNNSGGTVAEATSKGLVAAISPQASRQTIDGQGAGNGGFGVYTPRPYDGNGFFAVGADGSLSLASATNQLFSSISVFIGSIDAYNSINLYDQNGAFIRSFSGTQMNNDVVPVYPGDGTSTGSRFVTFNGTDGTLFSKIQFYNTGGQSAFEFDNVSFTAAVPEPATWAMMLLGFGMVAGAARYRRRSSKAVYA